MNGVEVRVARIFNTYGPRMLPDDGRVVSNLHRAGSAGGTADAVRRWQPDSFFLLRQ